MTRGCKVVIIGGGSGVASALPGLRGLSDDVSVISCITDDGRSSGILSNATGLPPPGDLRQALTALSKDPDGLLPQMFQFRFSDRYPNGLAGHNLGNLMLVALAEMYGDHLGHAVEEAARILGTVGRVYPASLHRATLVGETVNGILLKGETNIAAHPQAVGHIYLDPGNLPANPEAVAAIEAADILVLGPGSLFTSVIPNLLIGGIAHTVARNTGVRAYVCNLTTQPGETDGYSAADHVRAIAAHVPQRLFDYVIVSDGLSPSCTSARQQGRNLGDGMPKVDFVRADAASIEALGYEAIVAPLCAEPVSGKHDTLRLAAIIASLRPSRSQPRRINPSDEPSQPRILPDREPLSTI